MFDLGVPPSCPLVQPVLPISHQPNLNLAEGGTGKIKVNPTQLSDQRAHPVSLSFSVFPSLEKRSGKTFVDSLGSLAVWVKRMVMPSRQLLRFLPVHHLLHYSHSTAEFYILQWRGNNVRIWASKEAFCSRSSLQVERNPWLYW